MKRAMPLAYRIYDDSTLSTARTTGLVENGEVEDYQWNFHPTAVSLAGFSTRSSAAATWLLWLMGLAGAAT